MVKKKFTKEEFCRKYPEHKKLRRTDPTQFNELYEQWNKYNSFIKNLFVWKF
jgi:hypothetical protein